MFKRKVVILVLLWVVCVAISLWFFRTPTAEDYQHYQQLMNYTDFSKKNSNKEKSLTKQQRFHVTKQIFFIKEKERLQWRLKSVSSELIFGQQADSLELVENFKDVVCSMQEKLIFCQDADCGTTKQPLDEGVALLSQEKMRLHPRQIMRCFKARRAVYHYKTEQMFAEGVELTRYTIPGHQWTENLQLFKPAMRGQAQSIRLSFSHRDPSFKAQGFQAIFQDWENAL